MKISIVTPSYNQGKFISRTIDSVLSQEGDFELEYIVMDGSSTDDSVKIIKNYEEKFKSRKILFKWISEKDKGQADAINKGFKIATGDVLAWLNSDDVFYPDALRKIVEVNWNKYDFCYGRGMWIDINDNDLLLYPTFKPTKSSLYWRCTLCQPTVFFKKSVWKNLGNLRTDLIGFDGEYWLRAVFANNKFKFVNSNIAKSRMYKENKSLNNQNKVKQEFKDLRRKYYFTCTFLKAFTKIYVRTFTNIYENRLFKKLN